MTEFPFRDSYYGDLQRDEDGRGPARMAKVSKILVYCEDSTHEGERIMVEKFARVPEGTGLKGHQPGAWTVWRPRGANWLFGQQDVEHDQQFGYDDDPEGGVTWIRSDGTPFEGEWGDLVPADARARHHLFCVCGYSVAARDERLQSVLATLHEHGITSISLRALAARLS